MKKQNLLQLGICTLFSLLGFAACTPKQERAQKIVERYMLDTFGHQWSPEIHEFDSIKIEKYYNGAIYDSECLLLAKKCIESIVQTDHYIASVAGIDADYYDIIDSVARSECDRYRQATKVLQEQLVERIKQVNPKVVGWRVHLAYSYTDLDDQSNADDITLFLDKGCKKVLAIGTYDQEGELMPSEIGIILLASDLLGSTSKEILWRTKSRFPIYD